MHISTEYFSNGDKTNITIANTNEPHLAYLDLTLAQSKGKGCDHVHFDGDNL